MMKTLTLPLLKLTLLLSCCSLTSCIEHYVDSNVETAKQDMSTDILKSKEVFNSKFKEVEESQVDSINNRMLQEFKYSIISTDNFLDSLKQTMEKLDENDVSNVELIKITFLHKGLGDSIIYKMKRSIAAAQSVTKTDEQKLAIQSASDSLFSEPSDYKWKEQMFGLTNPLGASMVLYGLQTELYNIGMKALDDK